MWEEDWARLGIEPTTELAAIKKAYAARLKHTRPDDDAEAYQALRGAYERAQQWARWEAQEAREAPAAQPPPVPDKAQPPDEAPVEASTRPADTAAPAGSPADAGAEPAGPLPDVDPQALIDELMTAWRNGGEAALLAHWPAVQAQLQAQSLPRLPWFSVSFARWVVHTPELPVSLLSSLDAHFGWLNDFRTERLLGAELALALREALDARLQRPLRDPGLQALAEPLLRLHAALAQGRRLWALLMALLLHPLLASARRELGPQLMGRVGLDEAAQTALRGLSTAGAWLRFGLAALLFAGLCALMGADGESVLNRLLTWAGFSVVLVSCAAFFGKVLGGAPSWITPKRHYTLPLQAWRRHRSQPLAGIGMVLAGAAAAVALGETPGLALPAAVGLLALAGLLLAWPLMPGHGMVLVGLAPMVALLFTHWLAPWLPMSTATLLGIAWLLTAAAAVEGRVQLAGVAEWPFRPALNSLVLIHRWGLFVALLPTLAAAAYVALPGGPSTNTGIFLTWVLGNLVVGRLQLSAETWGLRELLRAEAA